VTVPAVRLASVCHPGPNAHHRLWCAIRRRRYRSAIDRTTRSILETIDVPEFRRRFTDNPAYAVHGDKGSSKYLHLERWLRVAVERYYAFGFLRLPRGSRILDLGCGSGYFLVAGKFLGYDPLGVDLDIDELYNEQIPFFGVCRVLHHVQPGDYLPQLEDRFDLVTGFMTGFNEYFDGRPWGAREWTEFLPELRGCLLKGREAFFQFNRNALAGGYYTAEARAAIASSRCFKVRFFANCLRLTAR
jgi:SAM-dependent methyltransferase